MKIANRTGTAYYLIGVLLTLAACQDATKSITEPAVSPEAPRIVGNVTIMGSGRVLHARPPGFIETSRYTQIGTRNARGGCRWRSRETLAHGQHVRMYVAEFDPKTCEFVIARSTVSDPRVVAERLAPNPAMTISGSAQASKPRDPQSSQLPSKSRMRVPAARMDFTCGGGSSCASASYSTGGGGDSRSSGFLQDLYTLDPVGWMTTEDYNYVGFSWNLQSGCLTFAQGIHGRFWMTDTFWHAGLHVEYFREFTCSNADNITTSYYWNTVFCDPYEVDVDYFNRIIAHPGGDYGSADYDAYIDIYDSGFCQGWLTPVMDRA